MNRRRFLQIGAMTGAWAAMCRSAWADAAASPAAGKTWGGWASGHFQIHFIYTGVAESMFLIFPDGTSMLLDCGDHAALTRLGHSVPVLPGPARLAGDWIARYVQRVNPAKNAVDYMLLSHFHADHCGTPNWQTRSRGKENCPLGTCHGARSGFGLAAEQLHFSRAIDRGWPDYNDPIPLLDGGDKELEHMKRVYAWLQKRDGLKIEKFRIGATDQIVPLKSAASCPDFSVKNIAANGKILLKDGSIRNLYAGHLKARKLNENGMSLGMIFQYGKFSFYTAGDFSDNLRQGGGLPLFAIEDAIADSLDPVSVAKINHHGHFSMPAKLISALRARVWMACVWGQLHAVAPVMERLADRSLYPGDRLLCPTVFPAERRREDAGKPWLADVPPEVFEGAHVVIDVPPGGETYSLTYLSAADEAMNVRGQMEFRA